MKNFLGKINKKLVFCATTASTVIGGAVASFAADVDMTGAITTGLADVQSQAMSAIGAVAPVAIAIAGAVVGVRVALHAFRSLVG